MRIAIINKMVKQTRDYDHIFSIDGFRQLSSYIVTNHDIYRRFIIFVLVKTRGLTSKEQKNTEFQISFAPTFASY